MGPAKRAIGSSALASGCSVWLGNWRLWIRAFWISVYALFLVLAVPPLVLDCIYTPATGSLPKIQLIGGLFALVTLPISFWEIVQHLIHFTKPYLQRHIIRILWMVPIYCVDAWFGLIYPKDTIYMNSLRDCYTAYVIYNFMQFLYNYLNSEGDYESKLRDREPVKHLPPCCCLRPWEMGPSFVKRVHNGILQFIVVRPITTAAAFICEMLGVYGENEMRWDVGFQYIQFINNTSQMMAMYCLVLFYKANRVELGPMKPIGKFICIKFVVFLTVFQSGIIGMLVNFGVIQLIFGIEDGGEVKLISSCLQNFLICIEMLFAAVAHHYVFTYKPYVDPDLEDLWWCEGLARACGKGAETYSSLDSDDDEAKPGERDRLLSAASEILRNGLPGNKRKMGAGWITNNNNNSYKAGKSDHWPEKPVDLSTRSYEYAT